MKCTSLALLVSLALILAGPASADHIGIYADPMGTYCHLEVLQNTVVSVYVVHIYTTGTKGSAFRVENNSGQLFLQPVALDGSITIGSVLTGIEVGYVDCRFGHFTPLRLDYFIVTSPPAPCDATLRIVPHPTYGWVVAVDCALVQEVASAGAFVFGPGYCSTCSANPTSETTWGGIKALYR